MLDSIRQFGLAVRFAEANRGKEDCSTDICFIAITTKNRDNIELISEFGKSIVV